MTAANLLRELAEPLEYGKPLKVVLDQLARLTGLKFSRCYEIWYGRARRIENHEIEAINEALRNKREREAANELHELRLRLERLEASFAAERADMACAPINAPRMRSRRMDRSLD